MQVKKTPPSRTSAEGFCRFFGASPVASALGIRSGATPRGRLQPTMPSLIEPSKADISTWQRRGHFYLALTEAREAVSPPRENVLFVPDRNVLLTGSGWGGEGSRSSDDD